MVNSCRETPGPIPNPEAKPAHADGTATGRLWESKSPPTPNNNTQQNTTKKRTVYHRPLLFAFYQPSRPVEGLICKARSMAEGYGGESRGGLTSCLRPQRGKGAPSCLCIRGLLNYFYYHRTAYSVAANGFNQGHREAGSTRLGVPGLCY